MWTGQEGLLLTHGGATCLVSGEWKGLAKSQACPQTPVKLHRVLEEASTWGAEGAGTLEELRQKLREPNEHTQGSS